MKVSIKGGAVTLAISLKLLTSGLACMAQQTDPTLTAAVILQTEELKSVHKKRKTTQEKIIAAETAVTLALDRVHSVENKMLEYLSNAQGAMQNLYQIKRAAELVTTEIPKNTTLLKNSVKGNLKGTAIAALVSDEITDAAERYYVANEVVTRLERINTDLFILAWQVRTLSWNDLWFSLDPEGWASVMAGKNIVNGLVTDWNNIKYY